jgi:hypothetical protein
LPTFIVISSKSYLSYLKENKILHDKQKLKEFMTTNLELQKILKGILHREEKEKHN